MNGISAISEENSASSEEIAASSQEQNASSEEVSSSSHILNEMTKEMSNQVNKFNNVFRNNLLKISIYWGEIKLDMYQLNT